MFNIKKTIYIFLVSLLIISVGSQTTLASSLDMSQGIMPDNPLYQIDLKIEELQLFTQTSDEGQAKLHLSFGTERLNEINYLTNKSEPNLTDIVNVSNDYQENISDFKKITIENKNISDKIDEITPQIEELQVLQSKVVDKINEKQAKTEVKIIVKSTIQESQSELIKAVENVKKPIAEKAAANVKEDSNNADKETVKKIDETLENLTKQKDLLKEEIKIDEDNLKSEKASANSEETNPISDNNQNEENNNTESNNENNNTDEESISYEPIEINTEKADNNESNMVDNQQENNNTITGEWYYSPSCDYVSTVEGKDPICGEDMLAVSSLPADHSFFQKYTIEDGKYVQNIEDIIAKEEKENQENDENNEIEEIEVEVVDNELATPTTTEYNDNLAETNTY